MHTSVPVYPRLLIPQLSRRGGIHTQNAHTQNAHKRSGLLPPSDSTTFTAQRYTHAKRTRAKCTQAFRFKSRLLIPQLWQRRGIHTQNAHTQNAHKRSGLNPACWFHNFRSAEVYTRKTHTRKMHTSVPVYSRLLIPQLSQRRGIHTQNAHTQNAHKRSGLLPPSDSTTFTAQRYTHAKRTHAKCTQAFRFTPASWFHNFRSAEVYTCKTHTRKMHTSVPVYSRLLIPQLFVAQWHWKRDWNPTSGGCWELTCTLPQYNISYVDCC